MWYKPARAGFYYQNAQNSLSDEDFNQYGKLLKKQCIMDTIILPIVSVIILAIGTGIYCFLEGIFQDIAVIGWTITIVFISFVLSFLGLLFFTIIHDWTYFIRLKKERIKRLRRDKENSAFSSINDLIINSSSWDEKSEMSDMK